MKKILLIIPAFVLLAAACNQQPAVQQNTQTSNPPAQQQTTQTPPQETTPSPTPTNETASWKIYTNTRFGFQITFTDAWKGYKVFSSEGSQGVGAPTYLEFSLPTTDKSRSVINITNNISGYASPLTITIIAKDKNYQGTGVKITQDNDNTYYYTINKDLPKDLQGLNFEIPKVISTFKFTAQVMTTSEKPTITNTSGPVIKGKTKPNYLVWAFGAGESCLTRNTMATYGAGKADANGNFSINIPNVAATGTINIVVAAFPENSTYANSGTGGSDACFPKTNLSDTVTFTY